MKLNEITEIVHPTSKLDIDNLAYVVYDEHGKEVNRHKFKFVYDSSPAMRAAAKEAAQLRAAFSKKYKEQKEREAEAKPLSKLEEEYAKIKAKWDKYYRTIWPSGKGPSALDAETTEVYLAQMDKWMERLMQLNLSVRSSVILGTYKATK